MLGNLFAANWNEAGLSRLRQAGSGARTPWSSPTGDSFVKIAKVLAGALTIVRQYGNLNVVGYGTTDTQESLFAPYDAKVIGDYTSLTQF